ncbi:MULTISPECIES: GIY-YIG nuclease family protein [unclassified Rhizobium]|uniref:GIY-YIG nuclease family protein n=1 Tax=unclassified Rhizobium TaxID=2613769 RepID=UPI0007F06537|nr:MULTISPECIES: GIY-YIG nuclease family protein [unclassified Rhizobium]ANL11976.1 GIY-YIG nuclease domain-containing protein [Rhizobium sp. N1341]ANM42821.1 GIY-YIG nuclease domain-containing protein [Rhizobium sp. N741]
MDAINEMTTSARIRELASQGLETAEIARQLGIRYQHVYNVLKASRTSPTPTVKHKRVAPSTTTKPPLPLSVLTEGGFAFAGRWMFSPTEELVVDVPLPKEVGVYTFVKHGFALYVGVATMGISKRLYFYGRPGISQRTSKRLNALIKGELLASGSIDIYVAIPPDLEWNGLPIHGSAGLELGLIKKYALPWNMRSAG